MSRMSDFCDIQCDYCFKWEAGRYINTKDQRRWMKIHRGWDYIKKERKDICKECLNKESSNGQT